MAGELSALGIALLWGITSLLLKGLSGRLPSIMLNSLRCIAGSLVLLPFVLITGGFSPPGGIEWPPLLGLFIATAVTIGVGDTLFVMGLKRLELSRAYPIYSCGFPLGTLAVSWVFLGKAMPPLALFGATLILGGLFFVTFPRGRMFDAVRFETGEERKGLLFVILSLLFASVGVVYMGTIVSSADLALANVVRYGGVSLLLALASVRDYAGFFSKGIPWRDIGIALLNGALALGLGGLGFLFALRLIGPPMTTILTSTSPLFILPLSLIFLKEKITRKLVLGVVLSVAGVVLIFMPQLLGV